MQTTSKATRADLEQMVRRDFPPEQFEEVMLLLDKFKKSSEELQLRVQMNILKICFGKIEFLRKTVPTAPDVPALDSAHVHQPVPKVTRKVVERIVHRDYLPEQISEVITILDEFNDESESHKARVQLAVLKLADKSLEKLREYIKTARADFRDVISPAEYPSYRWDTFKLPAEEREKIYAKDWQQYLAWANAK